MQIDFGQKDLVLDGQIVRVHFLSEFCRFPDEYTLRRIRQRIKVHGSTGLNLLLFISKAFR